MDKPEWWLKNANMSANLHWALQGLRRLLANGGRFTRSASAEAAKSELRESMDPISQFCQDRAIVDPEAKVSTQELYQNYQRWCIDRGYKALSAGTLPAQILRCFPPQTVVKKACRNKDKTSQHYVGIRLRTDQDAVV